MDENERRGLEARIELLELDLAGRPKPTKAKPVEEKPIEPVAPSDGFVYMTGAEFRMRQYNRDLPALKPEELAKIRLEG